jgi:hypothetical protein
MAQAGVEGARASVETEEFVTKSRDDLTGVDMNALCSMTSEQLKEIVELSLAQEPPNEIIATAAGMVAVMRFSGRPAATRLIDSRKEVPVIMTAFPHMD